MLITGVRTILPFLFNGIFFISIAIFPANAAVLPSTGEMVALKDYLILPKDSATDNDKKAFGETLLKAVGDKNKIYTSDVDCCGIGFWSVPLTDQQRTDLSTDNVVDAIEEDVEETWSSVDPPTTEGRSLKYDIKNSLTKRAIVHEQTAQGEMLFISQPPNTNLIDLDHYNFDDSAGKDISLYIIDSGANKDHSEYKGIPNKRWMYTNWWKSLLPGSESDEDDHGSCVLAKAAGPTLGVARNADIVIVKSTLRTSRMLDAFYKIRNDVEKKGKKGKAVINFSGIFGNKAPDAQKDKWTKRYLQPLIDDDVVIVLASGNFAEKTPDINSYPQTAARTLPIINVGNCNDDGKTSSTSQGGPLLSVVAPGDHIRCATNKKDVFAIRSGTSFSAPTVAGLAAYFLAIPAYDNELQVEKKVAEKVKGLIERLAWTRTQGTVRGIWNDQAKYTAPPPYATGTCRLHLTEWSPNLIRFNRYAVEDAIAVDIFDAAGINIGGTPRVDSSRQPQDPTIKSKLPDPLVVHTQDKDHGDYVQFTLGDKAWPSNNINPLTPQAKCTVGEWDHHVDESNREMDCSFPC